MCFSLKMNRYVNGHLRTPGETATARRVPKLSRPQYVLNFAKNNLRDNIPNTFIALHILFTLPASVANGEWIFSQGKVDQNIHSVLNLSTLPIEHEITQNIHLKGLVYTFGKLKARKVEFWIVMINFVAGTHSTTSCDQYYMLRIKCMSSCP